MLHILYNLYVLICHMNDLRFNKVYVLFCSVLVSLESNVKLSIAFLFSLEYMIYLARKKNLIDGFC